MNSEDLYFLHGEALRIVLDSAKATNNRTQFFNVLSWIRNVYERRNVEIPHHLKHTSYYNNGRTLLYQVFLAIGICNCSICTDIVAAFPLDLPLNHTTGA